MMTLLAATLIALAPGEAAAPLNLEGARAVAVERAAAVEEATWQAEAADGVADSALQGALPSVSAFGSVSTGAGLTSFGIERQVSTQIGLGFTGSWRILSPEAWAASRSARRTAEGREALLTWARVSARRDATAAYAEALAAQATAAALAEAEADARRALTAVTSLVEAGLRPPADVDRARADALSLAARAAEARGRSATACANLEVLLTLPVDGRCQLAPVAWAEPQPAPAGEHPALVASRAAVGAAQASGREAWARHLPDAGVSATAAEYILPGVGAGFGWSTTFDLQVPLTLITGGMGDVRASRYGVAVADSRLREQARSLELSLITAQATWDAAQAALTARQGALEAAESAWRQLDQRYAAGLVGITDWLSARQARVEAQVALIAAQAALGVALAELEAARGVVGDRDPSLELDRP